ncbi:unnamed protein product [Victoria cruziana]
MGVVCDFCGDQRSVVYCKSDAACLCLSCDRNVHSANALSQRHSRTLLCDGCNSQPARVRCIEEKMSFCPNCDWNRHGGSTTTSEHKRQAINSYVGCPSAADLSRIWSFILEFPSSGDSKCEEGIPLASINENSVTNCWEPSSSNNLDLTIPNQLGEMETTEKGNFWMESSPLPPLNSMPFGVDHQDGMIDSALQKLSCDGLKDLGIFEDAELYEDLNMGDVDLTFENYEELFGNSQSNSQLPFDDGGADRLLLGKNVSAAGSNGRNGIFLEASPSAADHASIDESLLVRPAKKLHSACRSVVSDSVMSNHCPDTDTTLCLPPRQACSNLSLAFSAMSGESSAGDYQDCGMSSMLLMGEPPWFPAGSDNSHTQASRDNAVMRYKEKKKTRK